MLPTCGEESNVELYCSSGAPSSASALSPRARSVRRRAGPAVRVVPATPTTSTPGWSASFARPGGARNTVAPTPWSAESPSRSVAPVKSSA